MGCSASTEGGTLPAPTPPATKGKDSKAQIKKDINTSKTLFSRLFCRKVQTTPRAEKKDKSSRSLWTRVKEFPGRFLSKTKLDEAQPVPESTNDNANGNDTERKLKKKKKKKKRKSPNQKQVAAWTERYEQTCNPEQMAASVKKCRKRRNNKVAPMPEPLPPIIEFVPEVPLKRVVTTTDMVHQLMEEQGATPKELLNAGLSVASGVKPNKFGVHYELMDFDRPPSRTYKHIRKAGLSPFGSKGGIKSEDHFKRRQKLAEALQDKEEKRLQQLADRIAFAQQRVENVDRVRQEKTWKEANLTISDLVRNQQGTSNQSWTLEESQSRPTTPCRPPSRARSHRQLLSIEEQEAELADRLKNADTARQQALEAKKDAARQHAIRRQQCLQRKAILAALNAVQLDGPGPSQQANDEEAAGIDGQQNATEQTEVIDYHDDDSMDEDELIVICDRITGEIKINHSHTHDDEAEEPELINFHEDESEEAELVDCDQEAMGEAKVVDSSHEAWGEARAADSNVEAWGEAEANDSEREVTNKHLPADLPKDLQDLYDGEFWNGYN